MSKRILLADDSLTIQKVVELTFMDEDFEVEAVGSGDEAIDRLGRELPNILIADVHMPGASGYEVCRQAKAMSADLPVLLLVGTFEALDEAEMVACGADGNLKKPFDSQELLQIVRRMTSGEAPARAEPPAAEALEGFEATSHGGDDDDVTAEFPVTGFDLGSSVDEELPESVPDPVGFATSALEPKASELEADPELAPVDLGINLDDEAPEEDLGQDLYGSGNETVLLDPVPAAASAPEPESEPEMPAAGANETAGGLSDADVDRVARRVVELMSDDAVREVAWDVIPDMVEIVIKERVRELEAETD